MAIYINGVKVAGLGKSGKSPYQIAIEGGYTGTEADFNAQLVNIGEASKGFDELKSQVENAKNEVANAVSQAQSDIADAKSEIDSAVSDAQTAVDTAKADINTAITEAKNEIETVKTDINTTVANAKTEIDAKVEEALATIPDSENLATKSYVNNAIADATAAIVTDIWYYGATAPENTKLLWIDSDTTTGGLKYYSGSAWVHVPVAWS